MGYANNEAIALDSVIPFRVMGPANRRCGSRESFRPTGARQREQHRQDRHHRSLHRHSLGVDAITSCDGRSQGPAPQLKNYAKPGCFLVAINSPDVDGQFVCVCLRADGGGWQYVCADVPNGESLHQRACRDVEEPAPSPGVNLSRCAIPTRAAVIAIRAACFEPALLTQVTPS